MEESTAIVHIGRFRELAPGGDAAVIELVELFLEQIREQLPRLREAIEKNALEDIEVIAHRCAGSSSTCGAGAISEPMVTLERMARTGTITNATALAGDATAAFVRTEDFLLGYVAGLRDAHRNG